MPIQNTDKFLVSRNNINYQTEAQDIMAIQDADLLLVERDEQIYKVEGTELKDYASLPYGEILKEYTAPWTAPRTKNFAASPNVVCMIDSAGNVRRSTDGFEWTTVLTGVISTVYRPNIAYGGNNIWLILPGSGNTFYRSTDDGLTWSGYTPSYSDWFGSLSSNNFLGIVGAPTATGSNFAVFAGYEIPNPSGGSMGASKMSYSLDGGDTWTGVILPGYGAGTVSAAATISDSPVWAIIIANSPSSVLFPTPPSGYYTIDNGVNWIPMLGSPLGSTGGLGVGGGGNSILGSGDIRIGDVFYPNLLYYNGTNTVTLSGLSGILNTFASIEGFNGTGIAAAGGEMISHTSSYQNKIAAIGTKGTFLLTDTSGAGICTRQENITSAGAGIIGFKDRFFFFGSDNKVYYTSRFT